MRLNCAHAARSPLSFAHSAPSQSASTVSTPYTGSTIHEVSLAHRKLAWVTLQKKRSLTSRSSPPSS